MGDVLRFDEEIIKQAGELVTEIIKKPEVRSVSIIIDWDLKAQSLPTGLWAPAAHADPLQASILMGAQLGRAITYQQQTTMRIMHHNLEANQKLQKETADNASAQAGPAATDGSGSPNV